MFLFRRWVEIYNPHNTKVVNIIIIYYHFTPCEFFTPTLVVFHKSLSDSKSPQALRTLLRILVDFNSTAVWIVTILYLIFSLSLFSRETFQVHQL